MTFDSAELKTLVTNKLKPQLWYSLKDQDYLPRRVLHRALGVDANELDTVVSSYPPGTRLQDILGSDETKVLLAKGEEKIGDRSLRWFCIDEKLMYPDGLGTVPVAGQFRLLQKSCPEYAPEKKRPAREVRNSTDKLARGIARQLKKRTIQLTAPQCVPHKRTAVVQKLR